MLLITQLLIVLAKAIRPDIPVAQGYCLQLLHRDPYPSKRVGIMHFIGGWVLIFPYCDKQKLIRTI